MGQVMESELDLERRDWDERGLIPVIVQDVDTKEVLLLAYMNRRALELSLEQGEVWFWSRSRGRLWHKGETSGNTQRIHEIRYDCDDDALLVLARPAGPACHTGAMSCFSRTLSRAQRPSNRVSDTIEALAATIEDRKAHPREDSYTCRLLASGDTEILKKVGEEAAEVIVAGALESDERLLCETADLLYHLLVMLASKNLAWTDVEAELRHRFK